MAINTRSNKVFCDEAHKDNVETSNKEKNVVFRSDELAEELNNEVMNEDDEP